jgi:two-component system, NtrC family, response regulator HupR/HoxA
MTDVFVQHPSAAMARATVRRWCGLALELSSVKGAEIAKPAVRPALCELMRQIEHGAQCQQSVAHACEQSQRAGRSVTSACHAGLNIVGKASGSLGFLHACGLRDANPQGSLATSPPATIPNPMTDSEWQAARAAHPSMTEADALFLHALLDETVSVLPQLRDQDLAAADAKSKLAHPFSEIVGRTPAVRQMAALLEKVVRTSATVLIHGESGTGKELIARALHYQGPRAKKNFVVQNCSAFNDNLLESALFGHTKGSFTGAVKDQKGLFEMADGGTFFLDEIGDMSAALQVKLLRVLQESTFTPVGGTKPVKVDVRIIAASHKDLAEMVSRRQFREDLFFRVNVLKITVPPLRERVGDIPELARHFVRKHHRGDGPPPVLHDSAIAKLCAYSWPGNIRELENEIERMRVLGGDVPALTSEMVSARVAAASGTVGEPGRSLMQITAEAESAAIVAELRTTGFDKEKAAARLGISQALLDLKCRAFGIEQA